MVDFPPYRGRILRSVVGRDFGGNIEIGEYAICIFAGYDFGREALLSSGPAHDEAGVPAGDEDNFVLPLSTVVLRLGMGEYVRANGREWPGRDPVGAQFALGQPVPMRGGLAYLTMPAHLGQFSVCILHTSAPDEIRCCFGR